MFAHFELPNLPEVSRRTVGAALVVGVAGLVAAFSFGYLLVGIGACIGLGLGTLNFRMIGVSVDKVTAMDVDNPKRPLAINTLGRMGIITVIALGLTFLNKPLGFGVLIGVVGGALIAIVLSTSRFGLLRESPAATLLALLALSYTGAETVGGSPYLAAFIAGLIVGNKDLLLHDRDHRQEEVLESYVEQTVDIVVLAIFVVLGLNLDVQALLDNLWAGLAVMAVFVLIARPVTVAICLGLDRRSRWTLQEGAFISWCRETGVVPVAVASLLLAEHVPGAELVTTLVTFAVVVTLLVQATTAGWVAGRLALLDDAPPTSS